MAKTLISKIKIRRGLKEQRLINKFEEGEMLFETDNRRLFIGVGDNEDANLDNETYGGTLAGNLNFILSGNTDPDENTLLRAYPGDIVFKNNTLWMKNAIGWESIKPVVDGTTITYNNENKLSFKSDAITVGDGLVKDGLNISLKLKNTGPIKIENTELTIGENALTGNYIDLSTFYANEFKKTGNKFYLKYNTNIFDSPTDGLTIKALPAGEKTDTTTIVDGKTYGTVNAIISSRFKQNNIETGLEVNVDNNIAITDNISVKNESNIVGLKPGLDNLLTVNESNGNFNGTLDPSITWSGNTRKTVKVFMNADGSGTGVDIKSAGLVTFNSGLTKNGKTYKKYAVPVYELPDEPIFYVLKLNQSGSSYVRGANLMGSRAYMLSGVNGAKEYLTISSITSEMFDSNTYVDTMNLNIPDGTIVSPGLFVETISGEIQIHPDSAPPSIIMLIKLSSNQLVITGFNLAPQNAISSVTGTIMLKNGTSINLVVASADGPSSTNDICNNYITFTNEISEIDYIVYNYNDQTTSYFV